MMTRDDAQRWADDLLAAWSDGNAEAAAALFTEDARYRSNPFREPMVGRSAITAYWERSAAAQSEVRVAAGSVVVDGDRVAVEWWASLSEGGADSTSTGSLFLTFDDRGLCRSLREVWMEAEGRADPHQEWGE